MIISLTGFMGCGKSSVGRKLSQLLCCPFMDLDSVIEERVGRSIPEIFATDGEAVFRRMEVEALRDILEEAGKLSAPFILSLGGGTVMTAECAELIREKTTCIYLRASVDTLVKNLSGEASGRPMLSACHVGRQKGDGTSADLLRTRIESLMSLRSSTYEAVATHIIDTDGLTIDILARTIQSLISK